MTNFDEARPEAQRTWRYDLRLWGFGLLAGRQVLLSHVRLAANTSISLIVALKRLLNLTA